MAQFGIAGQPEKALEVCAPTRPAMPAATGTGPRRGGACRLQQNLRRESCPLPAPSHCLRSRLASMQWRPRRRPGLAWSGLVTHGRRVAVARQGHRGRPQQGAELAGHRVLCDLRCNPATLPPALPPPGMGLAISMRAPLPQLMSLMVVVADISCGSGALILIASPMPGFAPQQFPGTEDRPGGRLALKRCGVRTPIFLRHALNHSGPPRLARLKEGPSAACVSRGLCATRRPSRQLQLQTLPGSCGHLAAARTSAARGAGAGAAKGRGHGACRPQHPHDAALH